jgi:hypothetical protein
MNSLPELILQETKGLPEEMAREVLDFVRFLKSKVKESSHLTDKELKLMQQEELSHLEKEFENYKLLFPNE